jgi:hypothetical protein
VFDVHFRPRRRERSVANWWRTRVDAMCTFGVPDLSEPLLSKGQFG